jgi:tetratricopeptide (TPR) repeat protein
MHAPRRHAPLLVLMLALAAPWLGTAPAGADQNDPRLNPLFEELRASTTAAEAKAIEQAIWDIWFESDDSLSELQLEAATTAMAGREWGQAREQLDALLERDPDFAEAWNRRATLFWLMRDLSASLRDVRQTLALEPRHFGALSGLGLIFMETDQVEGAIRAFETALEIHPHLPGARQHLEQLEKRRTGEPL